MSGQKRTAAVALRRAESAWGMRVAGSSWQEVADALGYGDKSNAIRACRRFLESIPAPDRAHQRQLWSDRIESLWTVAVDDVERHRPGAVRAAVAVAQRAAAMWGLDAPTHLQVSTPESEEFDKALVTIFEHRNPDRPKEIDVFDLDEPLELEAVSEPPDEDG